MLTRSPRITGLSTDTVFGFKVPFTVQTCNAMYVKLSFQR